MCTESRRQLTLCGPVAGFYTSLGGDEPPSAFLLIRKLVIRVSSVTEICTSYLFIFVNKWPSSTELFGTARIILTARGKYVCSTSLSLQNQTNDGLINLTRTSHLLVGSPSHSEFKYLRYIRTISVYLLWFKGKKIRTSDTDFTLKTSDKKLSNDSRWQIVLCSAKHKNTQ